MRQVRSTRVTALQIFRMIALPGKILLHIVLFGMKVLLVMFGILAFGIARTGRSE
jgi:hypothetical protein